MPGALGNSDSAMQSREDPTLSNVMGSSSASCAAYWLHEGQLTALGIRALIGKVQGGGIGGRISRMSSVVLVGAPFPVGLAVVPPPVLRALGFAVHS